MKVTLITPVLNEAKHIDDFMRSVLQQTKKPDQWIIVDGGSNDGTLGILVFYQYYNPFIKIIRQKSSIGAARNLAIKKAKHEVIACTDCGCILDKHWLKNITLPFKQWDAEVVVGSYEAYATNCFEYWQGYATVKPNISVTRASSRSIAFRKECWKKVGGYPEKRGCGEDTKFNLKLRKQGYFILSAPNAIVHWRMRPTLKAVFKQFCGYGRGDLINGNLKHLPLNNVLIWGFWIFLVLLFFKTALVLLLLFFYGFFVGSIAAIRTGKLSALLYVPVIIATMRVGYVLGASGVKK